MEPQRSQGAMEVPKSKGGARKLERTQRAIEETDGQHGSTESS